MGDGNVAGGDLRKRLSGVMKHPSPMNYMTPRTLHIRQRMPIRQWSEEELAFLVSEYPKKGKDYCAERLGRSRHQIRAKCWRMGLKVESGCESLLERYRKQGNRLRGRKRPGHGERLRQMYRDGKVARGWGPKPPPKKRVYKPALPRAAEQIEATRASKSARMKKMHADRGHPMLGRRQSEESRRKMSEGQRNRTPEEQEEITRKQLETRMRNGNPYRAPERPKASWKAAWREIGGKRCFFRSAWEANYARYLQLLKAAGNISDWLHEPETFWFKGIKRGCVSYLPDFKVDRPDGSIEYHEVKGWMDDRSKTKIARMAKYFPEVRLIVVDGKAYRRLARQVSPLIPGWEKGSK